MYAVTWGNIMTDTRNTRWYLDIMSPNTKGEKFAWLDPTSIYINGEAFTQLLDAVSYTHLTLPTILLV